MLLGGAGGSPFMAVQIIVNRTLFGPEKKRQQNRSDVMGQKLRGVAAVTGEGTYGGAGTLEGGASGEAVRLKRTHDVLIRSKPKTPKRSAQATDAGSRLKYVWPNAKGAVVGKTACLPFFYPVFPACVRI